MKISLYAVVAWLLYIVLLGTSSCNSSKNVVKTKWYSVDSTIVVDGKIDEWERPLIESNAYTGVQYSTGNDAQNFYLCIRINDKTIQRRIMGLGMSVYLDTLAKRKEKIGIGYPLALTQEQLETISFQAAKGNFKVDDRALDEAYATVCQEFELIGFVEEDPEERIRVSNLASKELKTAIGFDHVGAMLCEFKIPLNQLYSGKMQYNEILSIGIKVNQPAPDAADDPGLFGDPSSNSITGNNQLQNPLLQGANPGGGMQQPRRSSNSNIAGIWAKVQLSQPR
ncbi:MULTISPECIES: hypothetical protein [unclassified Aureispira]|uniref:hypothetical protein n=1 Tax=unclassified Aureispira TaxID=2649989 RepID=UPI000695E34E|nr:MULTISPECIES: hypothetical protein [unclassified Aureispira]WMX14494.1 hypothetical protein QP953_26925 [Aureispira sp. CCB-E]